MSKQSKRQMGGSGEALPSGAVGEIVEAIGTTDFYITTTSGISTATAVTVNLTPGTYMLIPSIHCKENASSSGVVRFGAVITTNSTAGWSLGATLLAGQVGVTIQSAGSFSLDTSGVPIFLTITAPQSVYLRITSFNNLSTGNIACRGSISGMRIA